MFYKLRKLFIPESDELTLGQWGTYLLIFILIAAIALLMEKF